ncbi:hypothetical protein [uncultured Hydrogenophaga sp.]|uniref:hypothetical protein n=1 Tax=uncultured Hydrogenophaga sp. TaxID=199683 RepID=UPI00265D620D|nr:hypothetical protein [uncultured Hydrogenophaga sp.]
MATPNYGYEKRQRELAKKQKKEEKLKAKAARKHEPGEGGPEDHQDDVPEASPEGTPPASASERS